MSQPEFRKAHPKIVLPTALQKQRPISERMLEQAQRAREAGDITLAQLFSYFAGEVRKLEAITGPINTVSWWTGFTLGLIAGFLLGILLLAVGA